MITLEELEKEYKEYAGDLKFDGLEEVDYEEFRDFVKGYPHTIDMEAFRVDGETAAELWFDLDDPDDNHIWGLEIFGDKPDDSENKYYINESLI